jgi:hypothetical protein
MTKKGEATKQQLLRDIEAYTCGEEPSPHVMLRAATIENWETSVRRRGKEFVMVVRGNASKHPDIPNGENIQTSAVVWFDRNCRWIRTTNSLYALGAGRRRWGCAQ